MQLCSDFLRHRGLGEDECRHRYFFGCNRCQLHSPLPTHHSRFSWKYLKTLGHNILKSRQLSYGWAEISAARYCVYNFRQKSYLSKLHFVPWEHWKCTMVPYACLRIKSKYSSMLKLKLQYFGHLMRRADSFEKTLMLGKIEGRRRRG